MTLGPKGLFRRHAARKLSHVLAMGALATLITSSACVRHPADGGTPGTKRLIFSFTMEDPINQNFVYIVAMRPSESENPIDQGPIPVVQPPWGNGFVAGNVTHFVRWDPAAAPAFQIYRMQSNLIDFFPIGTPVVVQDVRTGDRTMRFEVDLRQLASSDDEANRFQSIQVNFFTMDTVPRTEAQSKIWDALGDGRNVAEINSPITIPLRTSGVYDNRRFGDLEPQGDVADPSLDIVNFSVEVRLF